MKQIRDAVVIGSGIIGSAAALALARAGIRRITLLEKGPLVSGMTRRNTGLVHPFQTHPLLCDLANASYDFYNQWAVHLGGKSSFVETGAAVVAQNGMDAGEQLAMWKQSVLNAAQFAPTALSAIFPNVSSHFSAALFTPQAGYADAVLTAQAMVNAAKERGLEVQTGTQVKQIIVQARQITGVTTTTGELEAPIVVAAAGSWTERLLAPLGYVLHLRFRRGVSVFYEQPQSLVGELPMVLDAQGTYYFRPHPYRMSAAGRIATETQTQGAETLDEFVTPIETADVNQFVQSVIPAFADVTPKRSHSILYDEPMDGRGVLGKIANLQGLYVAAGFGTSAFSIAPAVGETLAQMVIDGSVGRDISWLDPLRPSLR